MNVYNYNVYRDLIVFIVLGVSVAAAADRMPHFVGKPSNTLAEALLNFSEYNQRMEIPPGGESGDAEMAGIHELAYTLEVALQKINESFDELTETLEEGAHCIGDRRSRNSESQR